MQKKNDLKIISVILCLAALLTGCGGKKPAAAASEFQDQEEFCSMMNLIESDEGVYYVQSVQGDPGYMVLKYVDKASAKETALCQKVNCKHNSKECQAVVEDMDFMSFLTYVNGKLYYMVLEYQKDHSKKLCLYSVNKDGTDKKLVHVFENQDTPPNVAGIYRGKLFVSLPTMIEFEDGMGSESAEPSLIMCDLQTGKETVIVDGKKANGVFTVPCGGSGDSIYFLEMGLYEGSWLKYKQYDFETKEISNILESEQRDAQFIWNDTLYLQSEENKKIEAYHIKTKEREDILEYDEAYDAAYFQIGYIELIQRIQEEGEDGQEKEFYKWYDLKEKKFLFDDFEPGDEVFVRMRMKNGDYWVEKEDKIYFYHAARKAWTEVKEIN